MEENNTLLISKIINVFGKSVLDGYLLSADFCYPLHVTSCRYAETFFRDDIIIIELHDFKCTDSDFQRLNSLENGNICSCVGNAVNTSSRKRIKILIDVVFFSLVMAELKRSRTFRVSCFRRLYAMCLRRLENAEETEFFCPDCLKHVWLLDTVIYLKPPRKSILDLKWSKKLEILVNEKCELENAMAWLSTLGGAFSALGDTYIDCAEKAGLISLQQLRIAFRIGDPLTVCRCKIYLVMSLLQKGYYRRGKIIIKELYHFSVGPEGSNDYKLKNMCIAVWNRLKYLKSQMYVHKIYLKDRYQAQ